jgi:hypothetical protein
MNDKLSKIFNSFITEELENNPSLTLDSYNGKIDVEWEDNSPVTPYGNLSFFIEYLKVSGLFDSLVSSFPHNYSSNNSPKSRDIVGTILLSILCGHKRYAHITSLRNDKVNPDLLGMSKICSEDSVRRCFEKLEEGRALSWIKDHLDFCYRPLLNEEWILDVDTTIKCLYGKQEGSVVGYNPRKPGRPSHSVPCKAA